MKPPETFTSVQRNRMQVRLLAWFDQHRRELPWRNSRNPYYIWVSEVMLQQTTVKAVIPRFQKFVERFPTVFDLAKAAEQDVLHVWQGLGYYRRARWPYQAAQQIVNQHNGQIPIKAEEWDTLTGIGRYTRNAILSQAFDQRLPIVEANSLRVLSRLFASWHDPKSTTGVIWLWDVAEQFLPKKRCGDWNQSLMELGALVCTVNNPNCSECPLRTDCKARRLGVSDEIPVGSKCAEKIAQLEVGLLVRNSTGVLIVQIPVKARRWGSMWTMPTKAMVDGVSELDTAKALANELGLKSPTLMPHRKLTYIVTRHRITLTVYTLDHRTSKLDLAAWADHGWVTSATANNYPMSTHQRRFFRESQLTLFDEN